MDLRGRSFVITGGSSGIGRELALRVAARGARVAIGARNREALEAVAAECRRAGGEAVAIATDVSDAEQCGVLVRGAIEAHGGIDVLVNNAGCGMWARLDEVTDLSIFERLMRVNYLGSVYCTWHALDALKQSRGLVCAVSSLTGKMGVPTRTGYAASKHAVQGFFDSLRVELRNTGVDVLVVSPGFVDTDIRDRVLGADGTPVGTSPRDESRGNMSVADCVSELVSAIERRKREVIMTPQARAGMLLRLVVPKLVDRMVAKAIGDRGR